MTPPLPSSGDSVPGWLLQLTFAVQYNPNCPKPWLVRLPGFRTAGLDGKSYTGPESERTRDALGFGATCEEAALKAKAVVDSQRQAFRAGVEASRSSRSTKASDSTSALLTV